MTAHRTSSDGLEKVFAYEEKSVSDARHWATAALDGLDKDFLFTVGLLISELVTNAYRHGTPGDITVKIVKRFGALHCRVANTQSGTKPCLALAADTAESGRGLAIIDAESSSWGWVDGGNGRTWVSFEIPIPAAGFEEVR